MKSDARMEIGARDSGDLVGTYTVETIRDGPFGPQIVRRQKVHNLVVNDGKEELLRIAAGMTTKVFDTMRLGKCDTTPTSADTGVKTPIADSRQTVDVTTMDGRTLQLIISYPSGTTTMLSATSINEIAIVLQWTTPGGTALNRSLITATDKTLSDKLKITYELHVT